MRHFCPAYGIRTLFYIKSPTDALKARIAEYKMLITPCGHGSEIEFSVNGKASLYHIVTEKTGEQRKTEITENGKEIFRGDAIKVGKEWILISESKKEEPDIIFRADTATPSEEELYPGYTALYNIVFSAKERRGDFSKVLLVIIFSVILFIDIRFPLLFWILKYRPGVDGGEPSDMYLSGQKFGRILMTAGIIISMLLTFLRI